MPPQRRVYGSFMKTSQESSLAIQQHLRHSEVTQRVLLLRLMLFALILIPAALFGALSLFAPNDILDRWYSVAALTAATQSAAAYAIPWVDLLRHARSTSFPQVAIVTTALAVVWWPAMTMGFLVLMVLGQRQGRRALRSSNTASHLLFLSLVSLPIGLFCFFVFFGIPGDPSFAAGLTSESRLGYALMGIIEVIFSSLLIASWPVFVLAFFDSLLNRNKHA